MRKTAAAFVLFVSSCTNVPHYVLMDRSAHPVPATEVNVFLPDDEVPEDCERVALLFARRNWHFTYGSLRNSLREDAGDYGANAIHLRFTSEESMAVFSGTPAPFGGMERDVDAIALYCPRERAERS
ncbi:MAG: hypothetical protein OXP70_02530 [Acidobacteriota bacterium]|nr:hypothetical protein [Candidatus Palauibacter rhopaloidicola]MDE2880709.1 hypothetical protein [Acidobacteriota bacterium]